MCRAVGAVLIATLFFIGGCDAPPTENRERDFAAPVDPDAVDPDAAPTPYDGTIDRSDGRDGGTVLPAFSFFVTSLRAMRTLSRSANGFGGDLRYGETGPGAGLRGADKMCTAIAETSMPGSSVKIWRAFLSVTADENGKQVNAIERIGKGPWYDRLGRLFANSPSELLHDRPPKADAIIIDDLPNEEGVPNRNPDATGNVDNHDILTGSNAQGELYSPTATCKDWTTSDGSSSNGEPRVGHSWPRRGGDGFLRNWISVFDVAGCAPFVNLVEGGPRNVDSHGVGSSGGYGGIYCFALTP